MEQAWKEEQTRVMDVTAKIEKRINELEGDVLEVRGDVVDIRKHFWDDVTINLSHSDDIIETAASMKQQVEVLSERERRYRHSAASLNKLKRLYRSPYFGRIDFCEIGEPHADQIYLGIASFQDGEFGPFLIYDWRAPVSSLYYDHSPGPATYQTPMGPINGQLELKRQFAIRDGRMQLMFDTGVTIGDEMLQKALSRNSDVQMKSIVATIQKEQNQIIRNDRSRMLIVQGSAGSGKTSAALQRVAYLLYKHRETLQADQIVLFSPNSMFNSYVSTVLPELGEENMQQTTFQQYLEHRLGARFQLEDPFDQLEYILSMQGSADYLVRMEGVRYKSSPDYFQLIVAYKDLLMHEGMIFKSIRFRGQVVMDKERVKEKFYGFDPAIRLSNRMEQLQDWLLEELTQFAEKLIHQSWVEDEMELLSSGDYHHAFQKLRNRRQDEQGSTFDDFENEQEILARLVVKRHLEPLKTEIKELGFVAVTDLYEQLFADEAIFAKLSNPETVPQHWPDICRQTLAKLKHSELAYEDATPYLFLQELVQGFESNNSIRHVFIDEVQDYSPFQLEFVKRLFPRSKMTALGDLNQAIFGHISAFNELDSLHNLYGAEHTEIYRLTRSYRSTFEIVMFTRGMVEGGQLIEPFHRRGDKPRVTVTTDLIDLHNKVDQSILKLRQEGYESIGVICKTAAESNEAYAALSSRHPLRLITKHTPAYEKGVLVIPAYLAKGVEFDAVLIYNGAETQYSRESERKLFYTACTRAMHQLQIFALGELSSFITSQPPDTYAFE